MEEEKGKEKESKGIAGNSIVIIGLFLILIMVLIPTPQLSVAIFDDEAEIDVVVRPQIKLARYLAFSQLTSGAIDVAVQGIINQRNITLALGHGVIVGDRLAVVDGLRIYAGEVLGVSGQVIDLDTPLDFNYSTNSTAITLTRELNVDGSSTPQIFQVGTVGGVSLQMTRFIFSMTDKSAGDDTTFGGCPALTNGVVLRFVNNATYNIWNIKTNAGIRTVAGDDFTYSDKVGPGNFGFSAKSTVNGQEKLDTSIEIAGDEMLQIIIQDDLTCLDTFTISAQGNTDLMTLD